MDADLYAKAVFSSSVLCTSQLFLSKLYSQLFEKSIELEDTPLRSNELKLPKRLHKPVLYAWLTSNDSSAQVEELFSIPNMSSTGTRNTGIYHSLYLAAHFINRSNSDYTALLSNSYRLIDPSEASVLNFNSVKPSIKRSELLFMDSSIFDTRPNDSTRYFSELSN